MRIIFNQRNKMLLSLRSDACPELRSLLAILSFKLGPNIDPCSNIPSVYVSVRRSVGSGKATQFGIQVFLCSLIIVPGDHLDSWPGFEFSITMLKESDDLFLAIRSDKRAALRQVKKMYAATGLKIDVIVSDSVGWSSICLGTHYQEKGDRHWQDFENHKTCFQLNIVMTVYSAPMPRIAVIRIHYWVEFDAPYKLPVLFTNGFIVSVQARISTQEC